MAKSFSSINKNFETFKEITNCKSKLVQSCQKGTDTSCCCMCRSQLVQREYAMHGVVDKVKDDKVKDDKVKAYKVKVLVCA